MGDFPATGKHKNHVMSFLRRLRLQCDGGWWGNTSGALSTFVEAHQRSYSDLSGEPNNTHGMHDFFATECSSTDDGKTVGNNIIHATAPTAHPARNNGCGANMRLGGQKCMGVTLRVCWSGIPLLFIGVINILQRFHMAAVQFTYAEDNPSLNSLLRNDVLCADAVAEDVRSSLAEETTLSMNDNDDASFNAVNAVLTNVTHKGNCAVRMLRNVKKKQQQAAVQEQGRQLRAAHGRPQARLEDDDRWRLSRVSAGRLSPRTSGSGSKGTPVESNLKNRGKVPKFAKVLSGHLQWAPNRLSSVLVSSKQTAQNSSSDII